MDATQLALILAIGALLGAWKLLEFLRDVIFNTDVEEHRLRNGRLVPERDWARPYKFKGKSRYFLLKRMTSTLAIPFDAVQRFGRRDKIVVVQQKEGGFLPVKDAWVVSKIQQDGTVGTEQIEPEQINAHFPMNLPEADEWLYDRAEETAKGGLYPMAPDKEQANKFMIIAGIISALLIVIAGVTVVMSNKYILKYQGEYAQSIIAAQVANTARETTIAILREWNATGKIPDANQTAVSAKPPDATSMVLNSMGIRI